LPEHLGEERMQALLKDVGISDVNELEYNKIPEGWKDYIEGDDLYGPESSRLPALLMAYGRLKYPYKLTKEIRENCETYMWKFSGRLIENWGGVGDLKKYCPGEFRDLVTFCADLFSNKETFKDALLNLL
jgi:hypothetical protein